MIWEILGTSVPDEETHVPDLLILANIGIVPNIPKIPKISNIPNITFITKYEETIYPCSRCFDEHCCYGSAIGHPEDDR